MNEEQKAAGLVEARLVLRNARTASLGVLDHETGGPLCALVNVAITSQFLPIILTSTLSRHTQCLDRDTRGSLLVTGELPAKGDALTGFRASLTGRFSRRAEKDVRDSYLAHHPYADVYAGFGDFGFWVMEPLKLYVVAGFGRVFTYDAQELLATV